MSHEKYEESDSNSPLLPAPNCLPGTTPERLDRMERTLNEVRGAIIGNDRMGHRGIIHRLSEVEAKVAGHDRKLLAFGGIMTGAMAAVEFFRHKFGPF